MATKQLQKLVFGKYTLKVEVFQISLYNVDAKSPLRMLFYFFYREYQLLQYLSPPLKHHSTSPSCLLLNPHLLPPPTISSICHKFCVINCIFDTLKQLCNRNHQLFHPTIIIFMLSPQSYRLNHYLHCCYHRQ